MLKRITIVSLIVMLVMLIATAVLIPFAVSQTAEAVSSIIAQYSVQEERMSISSDGIKTISFDHGKWIQSVELLPSPDGDIHIYSDEYAVRDSQFSYSIETEQGHLEIGRYPRSGWNGLSVISPENLMISLSTLFSDNDPGVQLYLPESVSYDLDSYMVGVTHWKEDEVNTYYAAESGEYNEWEEAVLNPQPQPSEQETSQKTAAELATVSNGALLEAARSYAENGDAEAFWKAADPMLDDLSAIYGKQMEEDPVWQDVDLAADFRLYMELQLRESLKEVDQERLERAYREGLVTKAEYYERDLQLDAEQEELEQQMDGMDQTEDMLERLERSNGVATLFTEGFDEDRVMTK